MQTSSARSRYVESVLGYMSSSSMRRIFDGDFASRWLPSVYSTPENSPSSPLSVTRGGGHERSGLTPPILLHPKSGRGTGISASGRPVAEMFERAVSGRLSDAR